MSVAWPVKLDADYPCRGIDAEGRSIHFDDLLSVGEEVADSVDADGNTYGPFRTVVARGDELWIVDD